MSDKTPIIVIFEDKSSAKSFYNKIGGNEDLKAHQKYLFVFDDHPDLNQKLLRIISDIKEHHDLPPIVITTEDASLG